MEITTEQKKNLITLAQGLWNEDRRDVKFDMETYSNFGKGTERDTECNTVGCAVGHAPFYGIKKRYNEDWSDYSHRTLIETGSEWAWCFSGLWAYRDNTRRGAAQRIIYLLQYGLPDTWKSQMDGDTPICYQHIQEFCSQWLKENTQ